MAAILVLLTISMLIAGGFLFAFSNSMRSGQFDDTVSPAVRMLLDDETKNKTKTEKKEKN